MGARYYELDSLRRDAIMVLGVLAEFKTFARISSSRSSSVVLQTPSVIGTQTILYSLWDDDYTYFILVQYNSTLDRRHAFVTVL